MKQTIIIQLLMLISINLFSQTELKPFVEEDFHEFDYQKYRQVFSDIDANSTSTDFLSDKAIQLVPFADYDGSDSAKIITYHRWQQLYIDPLQPCNNTPALKAANTSNIEYSQDISSDLVEVENNSEVLVSAFPNPSNGRFCIQIKNAENIDNIEVINIQGITVYKTGSEPYNEIFIDITNQPTGTYLVNVSLNGKIQTTKIIKK